MDLVFFCNTMDMTSLLSIFILVRFPPVLLLFSILSSAVLLLQALSFLETLLLSFSFICFTFSASLLLMHLGTPSTNLCPCLLPPLLLLCGLWCFRQHTLLETFHLRHLIHPTDTTMTHFDCYDVEKHDSGRESQIGKVQPVLSCTPHKITCIVSTTSCSSRGAPTDHLWTDCRKSHAHSDLDPHTTASPRTVSDAQ